MHGSGDVTSNPAYLECRGVSGKLLDCLQCDRMNNKIYCINPELILIS